MNDLSLARILDDQRSTWIQYRVVLICAGVAFCDGYSVQAVNYAAPAMRAALSISTGELGIIFSLGLLGMTIGSLAISPFGDKVGRRGPLILSALLFGLLTSATALSTAWWHVALLRLMDGIALGSALPNAYVMAGEFSPARSRRLAIGFTVLGYSAGSFVAGTAIATVIDYLGWQAVFLAGGIAAILIALAGFIWLPESVSVLVRNPDDHHRAKLLLRKIAPSFKGSIDQISSHDTLPQNAVKTILGNEYLNFTIFHWAVSFTAMMVAILYFSWTPTILSDQRLDLKTASTVTVMFNVGTSAAAIVCGWLMDRWRPAHVVPACLSIGVLAFAGMGHVGDAVIPLSLFASTAGLGVGVALAAISVVPATVYPAEARVTGSGWAIGVARFGGVIGPLIGAFLVSSGFGANRLFHTLAFITFIAALLAMVMAFKTNQNHDSMQSANNNNQ